VFLRHRRREGHVVPGGVAAEHPLVERELRGEGPLGDREGGDRDGDDQGGVLNPRRRHFAPSLGRFPVAEQRRQQADPDAEEDDPAEPQQAQGAEDLERDDEHGDTEGGVAEPRQSAREFGHDPASQPVAAEAVRRDDPDHGEAADYVGAEVRCHGRVMLFAAAPATPAQGVAAGMLQATPVPFRPQ
jgi:hypothetical protein